jgi:hypothetical protein
MLRETRGGEIGAFESDEWKPPSELPGAPMGVRGTPNARQDFVFHDGGADLRAALAGLGDLGLLDLAELPIDFGLHHHFFRLESQLV